MEATLMVHTEDMYYKKFYERKILLLLFCTTKNEDEISEKNLFRLDQVLSNESQTW